MASTTLEEIKNMIIELRDDFIKQLSTRQVNSKQIRTNTLSDISETLGLIKAGEFRSGNGSDPGKGFSGVRIGYPSFTYGGKEWNVAGVSLDELQFGLDALTGEATFSGGDINLTSNGIESESRRSVQLSRNLYFNAVGDISNYSIVGGVPFTDGSSVAYASYGNHYMEVGSATNKLASSGFDSDIGSWSSESGTPTVGTDTQGSYLKLIAEVNSDYDYTRQDSVSQSISTSSGTVYIVDVEMKAISNLSDTELYNPAILIEADAGGLFINFPTDTITKRVGVFTATDTSTKIILTPSAYVGDSHSEGVELRIYSIVIYPLYGYGKMEYNGKTLILGAYPVGGSTSASVNISSGLSFNQLSSTPALSTGIPVIYYKGTKLIIVRYDIALPGYRYYYLDLASGSGTWTYTTTAP